MKALLLFVLLVSLYDRNFNGTDWERDNAYPNQKVMPYNDRPYDQ
jgi:hypothetical protein